MVLHYALYFTVPAGLTYLYFRRDAPTNKELERDLRAQHRQSYSGFVGGSSNSKNVTSLIKSSAESGAAEFDKEKIESKEALETEAKLRVLMKRGVDGKDPANEVKNYDSWK